MVSCVCQSDNRRKHIIYIGILFITYQTISYIKMIIRGDEKPRNQVNTKRFKHYKNDDILSRGSCYKHA